MATPITWRNVNAPNPGAALNALDRAGQNLGRSIKGLGQDVQGFADDEQERQTDEFVSVLNSLETDEERTQLVQNANKAFLDLNRVSEAQIAAQNQDFRVAAEGRAVDLAASNLATAELGRDRTAQQIAQDEILHPLEVEEAIQQADISDQALDAAINKADRADTRFDQEQLDLAANAPIVEAQRQETLAATQDKATARKNEITAKKQIAALRTGTTQEQIDLLNKFQGENINNLFDSKTQALLNDTQKRLINKSAPSIKSLTSVIIQSIPFPEGTDLTKVKLSDIPNNVFTNDFKTSLENGLAADLQQRFGNLTAAEAQQIAQTQLAKNTEAGRKFASTARTTKLASDQLDVFTQAKLDQFKINIEDVNRMDRNPELLIGNTIVNNINKHGGSVSLSENAELQETLTGVIDTLRSALNYSNIPAKDRGAVNLAILDLLSNITKDDDLIPFNRTDFVLPSISKERDISGLSSAELLQSFQRAFPLSSVVGKIVNTPTAPFREPAQQAAQELLKGGSQITDAEIESLSNRTGPGLQRQIDSFQNLNSQIPAQNQNPDNRAILRSLLNR